VKWVSGWLGTKWEGDFGGRRWVWWWRTAGGGVLVVGEGGCRRWVWAYLNFREERDEGEGFRVFVWLFGKNGGSGGGGKCDLKAVHARPKTEYVRTYIGKFDRTRAGCMSVK
jgi:hypothetical protein